VIPNIGFPSGKNKTVIVDLEDKFLSNERKVRIRTNMEIYWDYAFFARRKSSGSTDDETESRFSGFPLSRISAQYRWEAGMARIGLTTAR
jgi:hypothetical protein